jgi:hypothetical protein
VVIAADEKIAALVAGPYLHRGIFSQQQQRHQRSAHRPRRSLCQWMRRHAQPSRDETNNT